MSELPRSIAGVGGASATAHARLGSVATPAPARDWPVGSELQLQVAAIEADGSIRLDGDGVRLLLRHWPAALPLPAYGSSWPFRLLLLDGKPRWQLQIPMPIPDAAPALAEPLVPVPAPQFHARAPTREGLAASYREAVLGRLAAAAAQFHHEAGQQLSGSLLALAGEQTMAALRQPPSAISPFPLSLPLWLWGGPLLQLSVEDPPDTAEDDVPPLDLLWQLPLADGTQLHGRLRWLPGVIWLDVWGDESARRQFAACWPGLAADYRAAGIGIDLHLGIIPRMHGLMLGMHGISLFEPTRLLAELFQAAAILFAALRPLPLMADWLVTVQE